MLFITKSHKCISFISRRWLPGVFTRSVALLNRAYSPHHPSSEVGIVQADFRQIDNNVGSDGQNYTVNQIGEMNQKLVPTAQVVRVETDVEHHHYRVNFSKIRQVLHFVPRWGVEQGMQQVIDG
jgi:nucleoside-diphosphate-sugar epimerase